MKTNQQLSMQFVSRPTYACYILNLSLKKTNGLIRQHKNQVVTCPSILASGQNDKPAIRYMVFLSLTAALQPTIFLGSRCWHWMGSFIIKHANSQIKNKQRAGPLQSAGNDIVKTSGEQQRRSYPATRELKTCEIHLILSITYFYSPARLKP